MEFYVRPETGIFYFRVDARILAGSEVGVDPYDDTDGGDADGGDDNLF